MLERLEPDPLHLITLSHRSGSTAANIPILVVPSGLVLNTGTGIWLAGGPSLQLLNNFVDLIPSNLKIL